MHSSNQIGGINGKDNYCLMMDVNICRPLIIIGLLQT